MYSFVAPRTGTYTFNAGKYGSQVDTVAGLFNWSGRRIAGNDDYKGTDSRFTAYLTAGTKYGFAVTNYTGTSTGGYKWSITGPPLSVDLDHDAGDGISSYGYAQLTGNSLYIYLSGTNNSNYYLYTHQVDVYLLDANGNSITDTPWSVWLETGGRFVPTRPSSDINMATYDLSGWDLREVVYIQIVVS